MSGAARTLEALTLGDRGRSVPVIVRTTGSGPVVVVTANVHGDEVTGVAVVHALDRWLDEAQIAGTTVLYPTLNPAGLQAGERRFMGRDLNRSFPGVSSGGTTVRAARAIWDDILSRAPDGVVDLHADSSSAIPYALVDRAVHVGSRARGPLEARAEALASATGLLWMREYPDAEYMRYQLDKSLAGALINHAGIPAVTVEAGPRRLADPSAVHATVAAVGGVMAHLGIVDPADTAEPMSGGPWRRDATPRAEWSGFFVPSMAPGAPFEAGEVLGQIRALDGEPRSLVTATARGRVISWAEGAWVEIGGSVGTVAVEDH